MSLLPHLRAKRKFGMAVYKRRNETRGDDDRGPRVIDSGNGAEVAAFWSLDLKRQIIAAIKKISMVFSELQGLSDYEKLDQARFKSVVYQSAHEIGVLSFLELLEQ